MTDVTLAVGDRVRKAGGSSTVYTVVSVGTVFDWKNAKHVARVHIENPLRAPNTDRKIYARDPSTRRWRRCRPWSKTASTPLTR